MVTQSSKTLSEATALFEEKLKRDSPTLASFRKKTRFSNKKKKRKKTLHPIYEEKSNNHWIC